MKIVALNFVALALVCATYTQPASAKDFGRTEKPGDMNMLQVEPSILNERFYTSGNAERKQYCGKVLPAGAPIPDNDAPLSEQKPAAKGTKEITETPSPSKSKEAAVGSSNSALGKNSAVTPTVPSSAPAVVAPASAVPDAK